MVGFDLFWLNFEPTLKFAAKFGTFAPKSGTPIFDAS